MQLQMQCMYDLRYDFVRGPCMGMRGRRRVIPEMSEAMLIPPDSEQCSQDKRTLNLTCATDGR